MWARFSPRRGGDKFGVRNVTSVANEVRQILWPDGDDAISAIDAIRGEYFKQGLPLAGDGFVLFPYYHATCNRHIDP